MNSVLAWVREQLFIYDLLETVRSKACFGMRARQYAGSLRVSQYLLTVGALPTEG